MQKPRRGFDFGSIIDPGCVSSYSPNWTTSSRIALGTVGSVFFAIAAGTQKQIVKYARRGPNYPTLNAGSTIAISVHSPPRRLAPLSVLTCLSAIPLPALSAASACLLFPNRPKIVLDFGHSPGYKHPYTYVYPLRVRPPKNLRNELRTNRQPPRVQALGNFNLTRFPAHPCEAPQFLRSRPQPLFEKSFHSPRCSPQITGVRALPRENWQPLRYRCARWGCLGSPFLTRGPVVCLSPSKASPKPTPLRRRHNRTAKNIF